jgi:hypothetical protein
LWSRQREVDAAQETLRRAGEIEARDEGVTAGAPLQTVDQRAGEEEGASV